MNEKDDTNALDNLCYLTDPVVTGNGDFDHARRIHPSTADHRHCGGVAQSHSGQTTGLRIRLRNNMKTATDGINVFPTRGFRGQVNCFTHLLADALFYVPSFYLIRPGAWGLAPRGRLGRHGLLLHILAFHKYGISHAGAGHCRCSSVSPGPLSRMLRQSAEFPRTTASHLDAHGIAACGQRVLQQIGKDLMHALNTDRKLQIHTVGFSQKLDVPAFPDWCQIGPDHPPDRLKIAGFSIGEAKETVRKIADTVKVAQKKLTD